MMNIGIDIKDNILMFYDEMLSNSHHRYRSWEDCYSFFQQTYPCSNDEQRDIATLHLAFYLASWGMYRGSSQLLQKNYKVHADVLQILLKKEYAVLIDIDFEDARLPVSILPLIVELIADLRYAYESLGVTPTDTLVSKVMMGTMGCIPAYDRYFVDGVNYWRKLPGNRSQGFPARLGADSYLGLVSFYRRFQEDILTVQKSTERNSIKYPVMKLIDMYFWNMGYQLNRVEASSQD